MLCLIDKLKEGDDLSSNIDKRYDELDAIRNNILERAKLQKNVIIVSVF